MAEKESIDIKIFDRVKLMAGFFLAIFLLLLDRFFKLVFVTGLVSQRFYLIGDVLSMQFVPNYNIAFSLPVSGWPLNLAIIFILVFLMSLWVKFYKQKKQNQAGLTLLIILGAISNLFDRFAYGYVVDYLDVKYFTVLNIADIMIVCGVAALTFFVIREKEDLV